MIKDEKANLEMKQGLRKRDRNYLGMSAKTKVWNRKPFCEVVEIFDSKRIPVNSEERAKRFGEIPYYGATGQVGWIDTPIFDEELVLLGEDGAPFLDPSKPKAYLIRGKSWVNNHAHVLRAKPGLINSFLLYQLNNLDYRPYVSGTTRLKLPQGSMKQILLLVPPEDEQQWVVSEIEKQFTRLDAGIAALKRAQANLKRYRAAALKAACEGRLVPTEAELARKDGRAFETGEQLLGRILTERRKKWQGRGKYKEPVGPDTEGLPALPEGWLWCMSDSLFTFVTSGSRGWAKYYSNSGAIFLRVGNLDHENISLDLNDIQYVMPPSGAEGVRTVVQPNDILISITADVGMVALVPGDLGEAYINQHVALARPLPLVCQRYLAYYLCSSEGGWGYFKKLQRGATKVGLGLDDIRSVPVPLPPLDEQKRIVAEVERLLSVVKELEGTAKDNSQKANQLKQRILAYSFSGRTIGN